MHKYGTIFLGVLMLLAGIYCMQVPEATFATLGWAIGFLMVFDSVGNIIAWNKFRQVGQSSGWDLVFAVVSLIFGILILGSGVLQFSIDAFLTVFVAAWIFISGCLRVVRAIRNDEGDPMFTSENSKNARIWTAVLGILMIIAGIMCFMNPAAEILGVGVFMGAAACVAGLNMITMGMQLQN